MEFEDFLKVWNTQGKGYLKTHRLIKPLLKDKLLMKRFTDSELELDIAMSAIMEIKHLMDNDDFWRSRKRKQGIRWFFQNRGGKQEGEPNWVWFYEHRENRLEEEQEKKEQHENVFKFEKVGELP